jgi:hypothetical protein
MNLVRCLSPFYSASHHSWIDTKRSVFISMFVPDHSSKMAGFTPPTGSAPASISRGRKERGAYVAALVGQELLSGKLGHSCPQAPQMAIKG